jgi:hypothetical protein
VAGRELTAHRPRVVLLTAALLLAACSGRVEPVPPDPSSSSPPEVGTVAAPSGQPEGEVRVAVPAAPTSWLPRPGSPAVVGDLAALWGLPLHHLDAAGQPRPALVEAASVDETGREVSLRLRPGRWSDGEPVTARDLAATVDSLRAEEDATVEGVEEVLVEDDHEARVVLASPTRTWPGLLGQIGVLPAHVLADGGLEAAADLAVTGGPFRLEDHQEGLSSRFVAHPDGPLGPPALAAIDVVVVPTYDTALGLLRDGDLDAIVGHLAVRATERAAALDEGGGDYDAAAPVGGTSVTLRWHEGGGLSGEARRAMAHGVRVAQQVEALDLGTSRVTYLPGLPVGAGDDVAVAPAAPEDLATVDGSLAVQREQEMLSLTASLLEAQVRGQEGRLRIERLPSPEDVRRAGDYDGELRVRRDAPWTSLTTWVSTAPSVVLAGDRAPALADGDAVAALTALDEQAWEHPLYRPRVTHVWRSQLHGLAPSSWPGAGFASAARWRWAGEP